MKFLKKHISKNEMWVFIPARSGSKSIKNKNIKKINGKPLIYYTLSIASRLKKIKKIIFSSDSQRYLNIAAKYTTIDSHLRSKKNSKHLSTDYDVFKEYIVQKLKRDESLPEFFLHLRPTTPVRNLKTLNNLINTFQKNSQKYSALRSVSELENPGYKTVIFKKKKLFSLFYKSFDLKIINKARQTYQKSYIPNGYADIIKTENLIKKSLHGSKVFGYIIKEFNSDIDNINDFKRTKLYLE
jgi:CMP-N,N'-diacetyllegionaminic acid synthase